MDELIKLKELTKALTDSGYLKDQIDSWKYAFNSVSAFVCITDLNFKIKFINKTLSVLLGISNLEFIDGHVDTICKDFMESCTEPSEITSDVQKLGISYSKAFKKWVDKNKYIIRDDIQRTVGYIFVFQDITKRKNSEIMLEQNQLRYRSLFESISSGVAIYDVIDDGKDFILKDLNKAGEFLGNKLVENVVGKSIHDVYNNVNLIDVIAVLQRVWKTGVSEHFLTEGYYKTDQYRWYKNFICCLYTGEIVIVFDDITKQKLTENKAIENEFLLNEAQRITSTGSWSLYIPKECYKDENSHYNLIWSDETYNIFGISRDSSEDLWQVFIESIHPEDKDYVMAAYLESLKTKKPYEITHRILTPDGSLKYIHEWCETKYNEDGIPVRSIGTVQDITVINMYSTMLKNSDSRFRKLIEDVEGISIQGYNEDRQVTFWNKYSENLYGYTEEEALGKKIEDLIVPHNMRDEVIELHRRWISYGEKISAEKIKLVDKFGKDVYVFSSHVMNELCGKKEMFVLI